MRLRLPLLLLPLAALADIQSGTPDPAPPGFEDFTSPLVLPAKPASGAGDWASAVTRARAFVKGLSNLEKVNITTGIGINGRCVGNTGHITRLKFQGFCLQDSPLGVRFTDFVSAFPAGINVASTWDRDLIFKRGAAMGAEFRGKGINVALGPMTNMGRVAAGGRNWEGFGAEPFLSGIATAQTVQGIQSKGVIACVKHFVANEQEHARGGSLSAAYSSNIDDRTMHEIYHWPFADAVQAGVGSVMCSYNRANQTFVCQNSKIINGLMKEELNFQGFLLTDWAALVSGVNSVLAGMDMNMPGFFKYGSGMDDVPDPSLSNNSFWGANLVTAVQNGTVPQSRLDDMVTRIFAAYFKMGQDKGYPPVNFATTTLNTLQNGVVVNEHVNVQDDHATLIRTIGGASAVLLKNTNGALPLDVSKHRHYGVFGSDAGPNPDGPNGCGDRNCDQGTLAMGWGSGTTNFPYLVDPLSAITAFVRAHNKGAMVEGVLNDGNTAQITGVASRADACLVFVNSDSGEGYITVDNINMGDRANLTLWHNGDGVIAETAAVCANTIVVMHTVGPVIVESWIDNPNVTAVISAGIPGQETGNAIVDVLFGAVNPSGKLPYTFAKQRSDYSADVVYAITANEQITYTEGLNIDYRHFDSAGIEPRFEFGFGLSYTSFKYSGLSVHTSIGKRNNNATTVAATHSTGAAAASTGASPASASIGVGIGASGSATAASGSATTAAGTGSATAAGTGSATAASGSATAATGSGTAASTSGTAAATTVPVSSNSTTTTGPVTPFPPETPPGGAASLWQTAVTVSFTVHNSGGVDGHEVSQVYLGFPASAGEPPKLLRGFERTLIKRGASAGVSVQLRKRDISIWDVKSQAWVVPKGKFTVMVGASSRDIRLTGSFTV